MSASRDIAVIGYACRFADADNVQQFWSNLVAGKTSFKPVPADRWDHEAFYSDHSRENDKTYVQRGAFMDDVSSFPAMHFGIAPRRVEVMDPQHRLVLDAVRVALQDAGLEKGGYDPRMVGTFLGVSTSEYRNLVTSRTTAMMMAHGALGRETDADGDWEIGQAVKNVAPISAFSMPGTLLNMTAANVAHQWKFGGPAYTVDAACASSLVAVHDAVTNIRAGICDMAVAGGVYLNLTPESLVGFSRIGAISKSGECRPFDEKADGFLQGDGCGVLVLKRLDLAQQDGDRIHAVIRGSGINNDGDSSGPMAPAVEGQFDVIRRAYDDAGLDPSGVGYVECHGTATKVGDPVEVTALRDVFGNDGAPVYIGSVKGNIGHTMSAAGVAGLLKAILAVEHGEIPPQAGFETPNAALELDASRFQIAKEAKAWKADGLRRAGASAFGFGGTNCHILVEEAPKADVEVAADPQLVVISADNRALLATHAAEVAEAVEASDASLADIAYSLTQARDHVSTRLAIVATTRDELVEELRGAAEKLAGDMPVMGPLSLNAFATPDAATEAKIAFMFPGQGAQRVGLLRDLYERYPGFKSRLDDLGEAASDLLEKPLTHYLYPELSGQPFDLDAAEEALKATEVCQPAMAAIGLALNGFLRDEFGLEPSACLGHSLGEFAAAAAGGLLTPEAAVRFVAERGRLMADLELDDFGAMAAVMGDEALVAGYLEGVDGVQIANLNHPRQTVISGATTAVEGVVATIKADAIKATLLRVSHAFHSPIVAPVADDLAALIDGLEFAAPNVPVYSAISTEAYTLENAVATFNAHATSPVNFMAAMNAAREAAETNVFIEVGAGTTLTSFASGTLPRNEVVAATLGSREDDGGAEFLRALGRLATLGVALDFSALSGAGRQVVTLPATRLDTKTYWVVRKKEVPLAIAKHDKPAAAATENGEATMSSKTTSTNPDALLTLFQEQAAILRQHAQILAAQTALLAGQDVDVQALMGGEMPTLPAMPVANVASVTVEAPAAQAPAASAVEAAPAPEVEAIDYAAIVYGAVAEVSAFPREALKDGQQLALDLGFDSLMFVDLATALQKAVPSLGQIPEDAFSMETTIADVVTFLAENAGGAPAANAEDAPEAAEEVVIDDVLRRYYPVWSARSMPKLPTRALGKLVVVADGDAGELVKALEAAAEKVVVTSTDAARSALVAEGASQLVWYVDGEGADALDLVQTAHELAKAVHEASGGKPEFFGIATVAGFESIVDGSAPWAAALHGFARSLDREWRAQVKAIDGANGIDFVNELASSANDAVVLFDGDTRYVQTLEEHAFAPQTATLGADDVVLVTGGTRGIGAKIAEAMATAAKDATFILVGRTAEAALSADQKANLAAMKELAAKTYYLSWDVTDADTGALEGMIAKVGAPTVVVHSAGLIRDREVQSKTTEDIHNVVSVKTRGFENVLAALDASKLRKVVAFTSWAGVFGNRAQTDYAAANAALDAKVRGLRKSGVDAVAIAWPAWESSEMVSTIPAAVKQAMRQKGVTFIADDAGVQAFLDELNTADSGAGNVVYGVSLPNEMRVVNTTFNVSLASHPYLADHVLRDKPVMPFAAALDYIATAGREATGINGAFAIEDLSLNRGIEVESPVTLELAAEASVKGDRAQVDVKVKAKTSAQPDAFVAYGGRFVTGSVVAPALDIDVSAGAQPSLSIDEFYAKRSFHGPSFRAIERVEKIGEGQISGILKTSTPADLLDDPMRTAWTVDPLAVDGALQLTLYYLQAKHGMAAFPTGFASYVQMRPFGDASVRATLVQEHLDDQRVVGSIVFETLDGETIAVMSGLEARVFQREVEDEGPEVPEEHWNISKFPEVEALEQRLQMAELIGLRNPYFHAHEGVAKNKAVIDGKEMVNFSSYNYLGFSGHPRVSGAAKDAVDTYGTSVSASRLASGEIPLHGNLERALSSFLGVEAALVFSAGHHTNESVIGHLFNEGDLIIHDSLAHNSILTGAELSGAKRMKFPHNDHVALEKLLKQLRGSYNKVGIMIEGVYSMDGDMPDLPKFIELKKKYKCLLYVDEAHSAGCIGPRGAGVADYFGIDPMEVDVWMGTLSKAFSSCGGYCAGSKQLIEYLKYTVPGFIFSAGISPANAAAALAAVEMLAEQPEVPQLLQARSKFFLERCKELGLDTGPSHDSAVVPVIVGNSMHCLQLSEALGERGINVQPIVYPAVDDDASRLRFFLSATHEEEELEYTARCVAEELTRIQSGAAAE